MKREDVLNCQFQEWYPLFREVTFRSEILELPQDFVAYLLEDGVFLPALSEAMPARSRFSEWEGEESAVVEDDDEDEPVVPTFEELETQVRAAIERLGGSVLPKLNWSSPKDAEWISPSGSMRCQNPGEIFLLLKSSDRIAHDLCHAFDACTSEVPPPSIQDDHQTTPGQQDEDTANGHSGVSGRAEREVLEGAGPFYLVLRRWLDLRPEMEFRCFVRGHRLLGISQREVTSFYASVVEQKQQYKNLIIQFFEDSIRRKFRSSDYVFDVYITRTLRVKLVDFNPYGVATLPLLFSWDELDEISEPRLVARNSWRTNGETNVSNGARNGSHDDTVSTPTQNGHVPRPEAARGLDREGGNDGTRDSARDSWGDGESVRASVEALSVDDGDVEFRVVESQGGVQPGLRAALGVPLDLVDRSPGSAMDDFLMQVREEAERELRGEMASGG